MPHELDAVRARILEAVAAAARRVGRDPTEIEIVAVAKTVPAERVRGAVEAGFTTIGENRVQEAESKVEAVNAGFERPPRWHLVGPLQSNKVRRAVALFDVIETIDSIALAHRVDRVAAELLPGRRYPVLLQANVDDDPSKAGFEPAALEHELEPILELSNLRVEGLMTVGRLVPDAEAARPTFLALRRLSERLRARDHRLGPALSMGMTDDFEVAIEEGATILRIGRAIFGHRH
ncbi:MAG: YggS family pyridoxal phosphate-dependent enzyme [Chloroflexi bacterium]|nr:YggS family pyridoxal phosphate-dependent enzyme [Chloroflexota bacterium]